MKVTMVSGILCGVACFTFISCLAGMGMEYSVERVALGDVVYNYHDDCLNIGAQVTVNGTCGCLSNGTFYYDIQQLYCFQENFRSNGKETVIMNGIYTVPLVNWSNDFGWTIVDNELYFINGTQITTSYCSYLSLQISMEKMAFSQWIPLSRTIFYLQEMNGTFSLRINSTDYSHEGQVYDLQMICHKEDNNNDLSLIIKFYGYRTYHANSNTTPTTPQDPTSETNVDTSTLLITQDPILPTSPITTAPTSSFLMTANTNTPPTTPQDPTTETNVDTSTLLITQDPILPTSPITTAPKSSDHKAAIIGGAAAGGLLFITIICLLVYCCYKRNKKDGELPNNSYSLPTQNHNQPTAFYITPNEWLTVETPPPVPDSPRPNQRHNYEYPNAAAYMEFPGNANNNENYEALNIEVNADQNYLDLSSTNKETNSLYEPLKNLNKASVDGDSNIYAGLNANQTS